jgi:formate--tetrahydrofolate ligase
VPVVVAINRFSDDTDAEHRAGRRTLRGFGAKRVLCRTGPRAAPAPRPRQCRGALTEAAAEHFRRSIPTTCRCGKGAHDRPRRSTAPRDISADKKVRDRFSELEKPPASATARSAWPRRSTRSRPTRSCSARRAATRCTIREVRLSAGAEFIVVICGDIMTMPGLPRVPAANAIRLNERGLVEGLF